MAFNCGPNRPPRTQPGFWLHDLGPFPGLVAGGEHAIVGEVYALDEVTLAVLDRLEDPRDSISA